MTQRPATLSETIIPRRSVGYDVMAFIGIERFVYHRQREEIRAVLEHEHVISLSTGEISDLAACFVEYLRRLHEARSGQLRAALLSDGGWPLHIDATGENGRGTLLVALAGWRQWVLGAWKIATECSDAILPCLLSLIAQFGAPCAIMRDLGQAVIRACSKFVSDLKLDIPVLGCHQHFLGDIGTDLLDPLHSKLRDLFRQFKIRPGLRALARDLGRRLGIDIADARCAFETWQKETAYRLASGAAGIAVVRGMAQWVLDFAADARYQTFPFDRPYLDLCDRCNSIRRAADAFLRTPPEDSQVRKAIQRLCHILNPVSSEVPFATVAEKLRGRAEIFDELRDTLRIVPRTAGKNQTPSAKPLSVEQAITELNDIKAGLEWLTDSLRERRPERGPAQDTRQAIDLVLSHIERHGKSLWGHQIALPDQTGGGIRLVERTNNLLETLFHTIKQGERRRSGRKNLAHDLEHLPPEAALTLNLKSEDYVKILCGSLTRLPHAFAQLDSARRNALTAATKQPAKDDSGTTTAPKIESASLPAADQRLIRSKTMSERISAAAHSRAPRSKVVPTGRGLATAN